MPREIEEAALVDGAGIFKTFYKIMLPSAVPILTTVFLFSFVWQWNDIFFIGWYMTNKTVLPLALDSLARNYFHQFVLETGLTTPVDPSYTILLNSVGCLFVILPLILLYLWGQKHFIESIERSGIIG